MKRTWLTSFSIPARNDWLAFCSCWLASARMESPKLLSPNSVKKTLVEMAGTSRPRVSFFMNTFRKLGFIDYHAGDALQVHSSLLNVVLHD
jgi:hypothetical protein